MTDRAAAYTFSMLLICLTAYLCFRGIAWVIANGWRSMLGLVALRGEAILTVDPDGGDVWAGRRYAPDVWAGLDCALAEPPLFPPDDIGALVDAINEDADREDFALWEAEFGERAQ